MRRRKLFPGRGGIQHVRTAFQGGGFISLPQPLPADIERGPGASAGLDAQSRLDVVAVIEITTAADIITPQVVWEAGGNTTGVSVVIENSSLDVYIGFNGDTLTPAMSTPIVANQSYSVGLEILPTGATPMSSLFVSTQGVATAQHLVTTVPIFEDWSGSDDMGVGIRGGGSMQGPTQFEFNANFLGSIDSLWRLYITSSITNTHT